MKLTKQQLETLYKLIYSGGKVYEEDTNYYIKEEDNKIKLSKLVVNNLISKNHLKKVNLGTRTGYVINLITENKKSKQLENMYGKLNVCLRKRIELFLLNPSLYTWENCRSIIVYRNIDTLWNIVASFDNKYENAKYFPQSFTVLRAIDEKIK